MSLDLFVIARNISKWVKHGKILRICREEANHTQEDLFTLKERQKYKPGIEFTRIGNQLYRVQIHGLFNSNNVSGLHCG